MAINLRPVFIGTNGTCLSRIVRNDSVSKPLSKGMLDGNLLAAFQDLPVSRQIEITRQIGTERGIVLKDWNSVDGPW